MAETIRFYYEYADHGYLSNFYDSPIVLDGRTWRTVEHYYQAQKTLDPEYAEQIRQAATADEAKKLGNDPRCSLRHDWEQHKVVAMEAALMAKFTQHPELRERLVRTADAILVEDSRKDYFWGIGADGSGRSMLGRLLMDVRRRLGGP